MDMVTPCCSSLVYIKRLHEIDNRANPNLHGKESNISAKSNPIDRRHAKNRLNIDWFVSCRDNVFNS